MNLVKHCCLLNEPACIKGIEIKPVTEMQDISISTVILKKLISFNFFNFLNTFDCVCFQTSLAYSSWQRSSALCVIYFTLCELGIRIICTLRTLFIVFNVGTPILSIPFSLSYDQKHLGFSTRLLPMILLI